MNCSRSKTPHRPAKYFLSRQTDRERTTQWADRRGGSGIERTADFPDPDCADAGECPPLRQKNPRSEGVRETRNSRVRSRVTTESKTPMGDLQKASTRREIPLRHHTGCLRRLAAFAAHQSLNSRRAGWCDLPARRAQPDQTLPLRTGKSPNCDAFTEMSDLLAGSHSAELSPFGNNEPICNSLSRPSDAEPGHQESGHAGCLDGPASPVLRGWGQTLTGAGTPADQRRGQAMCVWFGQNRRSSRRLMMPSFV